jgi:hypothetical protein
VRGRLLHEDVLAGGQRRQRDRHVQVVGHADEHGIDIGACQSLLVRRGFGRCDAEVGAGPFPLHIVDVGDASQVGAPRREQRLHHLAPAAPAADKRDAEPVVGAEDPPVGER